MLISQLAEALGAELGWGANAGCSRVQGIRDFEISALSSIECAMELSVVFAEDDAALTRALASPAGAILTTEALAVANLVAVPRGVLLRTGADPELKSEAASAPGQGAPAMLLPAVLPEVLLVDHPRLAFARAARLLAPPVVRTGIHPQASIAPSAVLGEDVSIGAFAVIGDRARVGAGTSIGSGTVLGEGVEVGAHCVLYPRVVLYPGTNLGDRVVVHAGAVLGADGFGYVRDPATGAYTQFPQQGTLVVEDEVEIGANTTIDRGALGATRIGRGTKIDNLVHLGHNVSVGANVVIAAQTGISGSSRVGEGAVLAGQVGIGDHAAVGPGVILGAQAGVLPHKELTGAGQLFWGTPAKPIKQFLRELARVARLGRSR